MIQCLIVGWKKIFPDDRFKRTSQWQSRWKKIKKNDGTV